MPRVVFEGVSKVYPGGIAAVSEIDLEVGDGELFVVVGPSGSGKSTLLRLVAGLEALDAGQIWIGDRRVDRLPPRDRDVAMVFQNPALYPHLSVASNLGFGLRARRVARAEIRTRVASVAERLGLSTLLRRRPATLSGGQRQRVALGRALAREPRVFLFDEPLSSLDAPLRAAMRAELSDMHRRLGSTILHVTHDQGEALALGDRVAIMDRGRILQSGPPLEVYDRPARRSVAEFVGTPPMNILPCILEKDAEDALRVVAEGTHPAVRWSLASQPAWAAPLRRLGEGRVDLGIRAEHVTIAGTEATGPGPAGWEAIAEVRRLEPLGHETLATLALGLHPLIVRLEARACPHPGDSVTLRFDPSRASWFDAGNGFALGLAPNTTGAG